MSPFFRHLPGRLAPLGSLVEKGLREVTLEITHRQLEPVAQEAAGELAADVAQTDECDLDVVTSLR